MKAQFRQSLLHTQTSCFADLYTLLESTQLFLQHLQTPNKPLPQLFFNSYSRYQQQINGTISSISRRETLSTCLNSRPAKIIGAGASLLLFYVMLEVRRPKPMSSFVSTVAFALCIFIFVRLRGLLSLGVRISQRYDHTILNQLENNPPSLEANEETPDILKKNP